jgi:hypothetical protein
MKEGGGGISLRGKNMKRDREKDKNLKTYRRKRKDRENSVKRTVSQFEMTYR